MIRSVLFVTSVCLCTFSILQQLSAQDYIHNWQFSDNGGTQLDAASNAGSIGTLFNNGGPKVGGGYLNIGQTPSFKYPFNSLINTVYLEKLSPHL